MSSRWGAWLSCPLLPSVRTGHGIQFSSFFLNSSMEVQFPCRMFTPFRCTIQWVLEYSQMCAATPRPFQDGFVFLLSVRRSESLAGTRACALRGHNPTALSLAPDSRPRVPLLPLACPTHPCVSPPRLRRPRSTSALSFI